MPNIRCFSFMLTKLFKKNYPQTDGIYNCLENDSFVNLTRKVEMETYSKRAEFFNEEKMLNLSLAHQKALTPLLQCPKNSIFLEIGGGRWPICFLFNAKRIPSNRIGYRIWQC